MPKDTLAQVFHFDLYGKREAKYDFLNQNSLESIEWNLLQPEAPNFFLVKKDFDQSGMYELGFKVDELFPKNGSGVKFRKDNLLVKNHFTPKDVKDMIHNINTLSKSVILKMYDFSETDDWQIDSKKGLFKSDDINSIIPVNYRPFDFRYTYYPIDTVNEIIPRGDSRRNLMRNIINGSLGFICFRQSRNGDIGNFWITKYTVSKDIISSLDSATIFPLYLYPEENSQDLFAKTERTPNLNQAIVDKIAEGLGLKFVNEPVPVPVVETLQCNVSTNVNVSTCDVTTGTGTFAPIDVLDYIYAVLHSPAYREKYKEFLKIDFPRIPFPTSPLPSPQERAQAVDRFWKLVKLGGEIRQIHLLESPVVEEYITQYPEDGNNMVVKTKYENGRVYINDTQYFDNVPETAWNFYIGGYQPAQKWLKDRKDRALEFEDILHYQKIIVALAETDRIMSIINGIDIEPK